MELFSTHWQSIIQDPGCKTAVEKETYSPRLQDNFLLSLWPGQKSAWIWISRRIDFNPRTYFVGPETCYCQQQSSRYPIFPSQAQDQSFAPCKGIRIPESRNFLLVESGILGFGIRNPALGIRNPTKDWNPESNLLKIHSWLDWATRSKEKPSMESLPRVYASTWWHTV